jgi:hypothetical protein
MVLRVLASFYPSSLRKTPTYFFAKIGIVERLVAVNFAEAFIFKMQSSSQSRSYWIGDAVFSRKAWAGLHSSRNSRLAFMIRWIY